MATEVVARQPNALTLTPAAEQSLRLVLDGWSPAEPLPASVSIEALRGAYRVAHARLAPASPEAIAVMLDRLWATLPMPRVRDKSGEWAPDVTAIAEWKRHLGPYPEDLLAAAVDDVVRTHRWETPPKIAQVIAAMSGEVADRTAWRNRLRLAGGKAAAPVEYTEDRHAAWLAKQSPEDLARLAEIRAAREAGVSAADLVEGAQAVPLMAGEVRR